MPFTHHGLEKLAKQQGLTPFDLMMNLGMAGDLVPGMELGAKAAKEAGEKVKAPAGRAATKVGQEASRYGRSLTSMSKNVLDKLGLSPLMGQEVKNLLSLASDLKRVGHHQSKPIIEDSLDLLTQLGPKSIDDPRFLSYIRRVNSHLADTLQQVAEHMGELKDAERGAKPASPFTPSQILSTNRPPVPAQSLQGAAGQAMSPEDLQALQDLFGKGK